MKLFFAVFFLIQILSAKSQKNITCVLLKQDKDVIINSGLLKTVNSNVKLLNVNCLSSDNFLIHFTIFSTNEGKINERIIKKEKLVESGFTKLKDLFKIAKANVRKDAEREITYFEFEQKSNENFFLIANKIKIVFEKNDSTYITYDNLTTTFFYEIRDFKQFTPVQSCASIINTKAILQPVPRTIDTAVGQPEVDFPDSSYGDYFPNKIFLEKINTDSSYHFVRYRELAHDKWQNYTYEFDFIKSKGIIRFWYYLPTKRGFEPLTRNRKYVKFE